MSNGESIGTAWPQASLLTDTAVMHAELAASDGASLVGFIQAASGSVLRTAQDKLRDIMSVRDFGAYGDNSHDDTAALQAALSAAAGRSLYIPPGIYRVTAPLAMAPATFVYGQGSKCTYLYFTLPAGSSDPLVSVNTGSGGTLSYGFGLANLSIIDQTTTPATTGLYVENMVDGLVQNINMTGMHVGIWFQGGQNRVVNLEISTLGGAMSSTIGVHATGENCGVGIYDSMVQSSTTIGQQIGIGYLFEGGATPTMHSANTYGCSTGCKLSAAGTTMYWPELVNCQFDTGSNTGLIIDPGLGGSIYGLSCQNLWCGTMGAYGVHIVPDSGTASGIEFVGGRIYNNALSGFVLEGGENISICGMHISGNGSGSNPGIAVTGAMKGLIISSNGIGQSVQFGNTQNYGIQLWPASISNVTITGNDLSGNVAGGVYNGSTASSVLATGNIGYNTDSISPTLLNSWVENGGVTSRTSFCKDSNNVVHIQGLIKAGAMATPAFTLPPGFRPAGDQYFACVSNGALGWAYVQASTGNVIPQYGSNAYFSLCGISFKAEQ